MADSLITLFKPKLDPAQEEELRRENQARYLANQSLGGMATYLGAKGGDLMGRGAVQAGAAIAGVDARSPGERENDAIAAAKAEVAKLGFDPADPKSIDQFYRQVIGILQRNGLVPQAMEVAKEYQAQKAAMTRAEAQMTDVQRKAAADKDRAENARAALGGKAPKVFQYMDRLQEVENKLSTLEPDNPEAAQLQRSADTLKALIARESEGKIRVADGGDRIVILDSQGGTIREIAKGKRPGTVGSDGGPKEPKTTLTEREKAEYLRLQILRNNGELMSEEDELKLEMYERQYGKKQDKNKQKVSEADLDATARTKIALQRAIVTAIRRAWEQLALNPKAVGLDKIFPGLVLDRFDEKGVPARAAIADIGSALINARSGAAVSALEFQRLEPFVPQKTDTFKATLDKLRQMYAGAEGAINGFREVNGLEPEALAPLPPIAQARAEARAKQNPAAQPAPTPAPAAAPKPAASAAPGQIRVQNEDDYNRLPSGTKYIDPQGNERTKR